MAIDSSACPHTHGPLRTGGFGPAVFLDRDGVLIADTGYPSDPAAIALLPGVGAGLRALQAADWRLVVVTNQSGVARGRFTLARVEEIHRRLVDLLAAEGVELDGLFFCPHHPAGQMAPYVLPCGHRKPGPGMLESAAACLGLSLRTCWMIGDQESDVAAAHTAGCRAVRLGAGETAADAAAADLPEAARVILADVS